MRVAVIGSGYVGLVAGACLAETGNEVVCADVDQAKIERLRRNQIPIYEPGLEPMVVRNQSEGRLAFTSDVAAAVRHGLVVFIAVGTPPDDDGSADLRHVLAVAKVIGQNLNEPKVVVTKSTVPVGTAEEVRATIRKETGGAFFMASNPEFLKEGAAIDDFMKPDRVVVGVDSPEAQEALGQLYAPFLRTGNPILFMDIPSAEVTKYAANAMLATRISFMNKIAKLCERVGADVGAVRQGIGTDRRIGPAFLFPGPGYGGSCFPKDVQALIRTGKAMGLNTDLWDAVEAVNGRQKQVLLDKLRAGLGSLNGRQIAVWGLAFKPETDDMRQSPSIPLIEGILAEGGTVVAHDPKAMETAHQVFGDRIRYGKDLYEGVRGADGLVIVTEWLVYRNPNLERIKTDLRTPLIVDGRNLFEPERMKSAGFRYLSIGRPS